MPEAYNDPELLAAQRAGRQAQYDAQLAAYHAENDQPDTRHLELAEITRCTLCDTEGYRPNRIVCDHVDRSASTASGRALVQAELDKIRQRKTDTARATVAQEGQP